MNPTREEVMLLAYVQGEINSGKTKIIIPGSLLVDVRKEVLDEIVHLCKLNGVEIVGLH